MKFYNFLLLTKSKSKKWLMRNKMGIKNVEMIIIKWERVWNDERERERESKWRYMPKLWAKQPRRVELLVLPMRIYNHNISLGIIFLGKMKLEIIFKKYVKWVTNLND